MKDNNKNSSSNNQEQEWKHSDFSWDAMKPDIFEKIEEEDPSFFEENKRRIFGFWFFGAVVVGLLVCAGIVTTLSWNENKNDVLAADLNSTNDLSVSKITQANTISTDNIVTNVTDENKNELNESKTNGEKLISTANKNIAATVISKKSNTLINKPSNSNTTISTNSELTTTTSETTIKTELVNKVVKESNLQNNNITIEKEKGELRGKTNALAIQTLTQQPLENDQNILSSRDKVVAVDSPGYENADKEKIKNHWRIAAIGGGLISFSKYKGNSSAVALRNDNTSPLFGWQYGLNLERTLTKKIKVFAGVERAVTYQSIDIETERGVTVEHEDVLLNVTHYVVGERTKYHHGDTTVNGVEYNRLVNYNELKSIQFNLGIARIFQINKQWSLNPYLGFSTNLITKQSGITVFADKSTAAYDNDNPIFKNLQYKLLTGISLEYALSDKVALSAAYRFDGQLNNGSLEENMKWRPNHHFLGLGAVYVW